MYLETMKVIWDQEKAKINLRKHRIHFADTEPVFFDPMALTRKTMTPKVNKGSFPSGLML